MRLVIVERLDQYDAILADADFAAVIEDAHPNPRLLELVTAIVRNYQSLDDVTRGRAGGGTNLSKYASNYGKTRAERGAVQMMVRSVTALYARYEPEHVRGMLIEGLAKRRLRVRYSRQGSQLVDNARFRIEDGQVYDSGTSSIDVIGFDGAVGECHDCKVQARYFKRKWVSELVRDVAPKGFKVALVTAQSKRVALHELQRNRIGVHRLAVVTHEDWNQLPLQP